LVLIIDYLELHQLQSMFDIPYCQHILKLHLKQRKYKIRLQKSIGSENVIFAHCYPHMPTGKVWIYRLLFVCVWVSVCTVTNFSAEDKASGVKFCTEFHQHPRQEISYLGELLQKPNPKSNDSARGGKYCHQTPVPCTDGALAISGGDWRLSAILALSMCVYTSVPKDGRTC